MLNKFNLLYEEIMNDIDREIRFRSCSKILDKKLSDAEKDELNKKYDQMVLKDLENALNSNDENGIYLVWGFSPISWSEHTFIDKLYQKNGKKYCDFHIREYNKQMKRIKERQIQFEREAKTPEGKEHRKSIIEDMKRRAKERYTFTAPVSNLMTQTPYNEFKKLETKLTGHDFPERKQIFKNATGDLKFVLEHELLGPLTNDRIFNLLKWKIAGQDSDYIILRSDVLSDQLLNKFKIDKNGEDYQKAKDTIQSNHSLYFNGGDCLLLTTKVIAKEGERFDTNRLSFEFSYKYEQLQGDNGRQLRKNGFIRD